jgi:hypothetical protein
MARVRHFEATRPFQYTPRRPRDPGTPPRRPEFVQLDPRHPEELLDDVFFTHPDNFVPSIDPKRGYAHSWGTANGSQAFSDMESMLARMHIRNFYIPYDKPTPEMQFVDALIQRKMSALQAARGDAEPLFGRDFLLFRRP